MESIPLIDGVDIVRASDMEVVPVSENDIEASLPRNYESKDGMLSSMLWDRVAAFANSRTVQLSLPKMSGQELNKGIEEGRGKMKKMMGMMMMGGAMKMAAMIPVAIAGLFVLAGKALIVSK
ncbi:lactoylglutathione lyase, partial [Danaus plexippus plexippus]